MESFECDVVIIGAGLSGLSAAYYLVKKDKSLRIVLLEAKDRIGGRTLTRQINAADGTKDFWDIGGEWIGRPQPHIHYLLKKFDLNVFEPVSPTSGRKTSDICPLSWSVYFDLWQLKRKLLKCWKKLEPFTHSSVYYSSKWDEIKMKAFIEENMWTLVGKEVVEAACHCMFGLTPSEMTLCFFLLNVEAAGGLDTFIQPDEFSGGECRVKGGMQQLCYHLLNKIGKQSLYLGQPVTHIVQSIEGARVTTMNGLHLLCQRVILAIPPHHAASIAYTPALNSKKIELLQKIPLAFLIKFTITYETEFWRKGKNRQPHGFQAVLTDPHMGPIGLVYDAMSGRGNPALSGFISHADKLDPDPKSRRCLILCLIEQILGPQCQQNLEFCLMDWSKEPYNGGCFLKNFIPETFKFFNEISVPEDRIHFAGTEAATVWCGFMNGAVQSGFRAASEVLYHLRPMLTASPYPEKDGTDGGSNLDKKSGKTDSPSTNWLKWLAMGAGIASLVYLCTKTNHRTASAGDTFVKNIRLVFHPSG